MKSCLLLSALAADGESTLFEPGPSRDHTERMLRAMGVQIESGTCSSEKSEFPQYWTRLHPPLPLSLKPLEMTLPGDISAAAFLIVAALITPGSEIQINGIGLNPTRTGLLDTLMEMGADITIQNNSEQAGEPVGDITIRYSHLQGVQVRGGRVVRMIDEFPAFAVATAVAHGETQVHDAQELRDKNRIGSMHSELSCDRLV